MVLLRDTPAFEVLLLRRNERTRFAPGHFVFPGGRVDPSDGLPAVTKLLDGPAPTDAASRLGLDAADPPAVAYYVAALREAFEEAGILLVGPEKDGPLVASADPAVEELRLALMRGTLPFSDLVAGLDVSLAGAKLSYIAHWVTPARSPLRYDTRFFAALVSGALEPVVDEREMTDGLWIRPERAIALNDRGELPMIQPTRHTLERLSAFVTAEEALAALANEPVRRMPG